LRRMNKTTLSLCLIGWIVFCAVPLPAQDAPNDAQVRMVVDLIKGADADMRTLGLQFVREQIPGEAVTKKMAELVSELEGSAQVELLEALGERGDAVARPAILKMVKSDNEAARAAALKALGPLGSAEDVAVLAEKAAGGSDSEKAAARQGLIRLGGDGVNAAVVAQLEKSEPNVRAELLEVLAARSANETVPTVLKCAEDEDTAVKAAALGALRQLADETHTADLVNLLKATKEDATRRKAELALLTICSRGREACTDAVLDGIAEADTASRVVLIRALARIGEAKGLDEVVAATLHDDEAVRDEAVRMLSGWRDPAAVAHLVEIAKTEGSLRHHVLAIRGLVRLAAPQGDQAADLTLLQEVMELAKRPQEKRLVVGALSATGSAAALDLVIAAMDDPAVANDATTAAVTIAEKQVPELAKIRSALQAVMEKSKDAKTRAKVQELLNSL
jgi:HEAT repeat protein